MPDKRNPPTVKFGDSLPARMLSVLLAALTVACLVLLASLFNQYVPPMALQWAGVAGVGLTAGLTARWLMRENTLILRMLTSITAMFLSLCLLGWVTPGKIGIRMDTQSSSGINWSGLGQFVVGSLTAYLALWAWRVKVGPEKKTLRKSLQRVSWKRTKKKGSAKTNRDITIGSRRPKKPVHRKARLKVEKPSADESQFWEPYWDRLRSKMQAAWISSSGLGSRIRTGLTFTAKLPPIHLRSSRPKEVQSSNLGRTEIHLMGEVEHRCPYCLEVVEKRDPRGVKVCPICHTHHHADCWKETGMCQVPHQYD